MTVVEADQLPYRPCVGVMLLNADGKVWIGHRTATNNTEYSGSPKLWQMPQGGIDKDEDPQAASLRELYEETGVSSVQLIDQTDGWLFYDLPTHLIGIGLKGSFVAKNKCGLSTALKAMSPKSALAHPRTATRQNSTIGDGKTSLPCPNSWWILSAASIRNWQSSSKPQPNLRRRKTHLADAEQQPNL